MDSFFVASHGVWYWHVDVLCWDDLWNAFISVVLPFRVVELPVYKGTNPWRNFRFEHWHVYRWILPKFSIKSYEKKAGNVEICKIVDWTFRPRSVLHNNNFFFQVDTIRRWVQYLPVLKSWKANAALPSDLWWKAKKLPRNYIFLLVNTKTKSIFTTS